MQNAPIVSINLKEASPMRVWLSGTLIALCLCVALFCRPAAAQSGQIFVGHISDPSGASIAGATVTIHNENTGEDVVTKTTGAGDYTAPYLKPGLYTITAVQSGFKTVSKTHITLSVDQNSKIDLSLPLGDVTESVTVSGSSAQVELSKADRGEIIGNERVEEMPSDGRNYMVLFGLSPGAHNFSNPIYPRQQDNVSGNLFISGVPQATVQQNLDGGTNDAGTNGWSASNVPMDTVAEFKVVLNPYDASYGRSGGGAVDVALKSGTNKIHGSLYEFARRPWLDAQAWQYDYQKSQGSTAVLPTQHKRDQFGLEADGPVVIPHIYNGRDKTFFTLQWEQAYENLPNTGGNYLSIPDANWLQGNFGSTSTEPLGIQYYDTVTKSLLPLGIYDPLQPLSPQAADPVDNVQKYARQQFGMNNCGGPAGSYKAPAANPPGTTVVCQIPINRMDPVGKAIAQYYTNLTPNNNPGPGYAPFSRNYYFLPIEYDTSRNGLFKLDHNFGSRDRGSLRWTGFERFALQSPNGVPTTDPTNNELDQVQPKEQQYAIEEIHTFSPNLLLDNKLTGGTQEQGIKFGFAPFDPSTLGFSSNFLTNTIIQDRFPNISVSGVEASSGTDYLNAAPGTRGHSATHNLGYQPSVTFIHGRHSFRAGFDMSLYQYSNFDNFQNNAFAFTQNFTNHYANGSDAPGMQSGSGFAGLLLGYANSGSLKLQTSPFYSQHYYAIWAQDDWKVTPKLTLNFGIRYDLQEARTERHNQLNYGFNTTDVNPLDGQLTTRVNLNGPLMGGTEFAGVNGAPRGAYATNLLNIQPRFGAAYAFSSRTSLRAGFGEMFIQDAATDHSNGFSAVTNFNNSLDNGVTPSLNNPCVPGMTGCGLAATGHTLGDPYATYVPISGSSLGQATTPGSSINFTNPKFQVPSIWQYSVSLEQQLTSRDVIDISYSGLKGYNLEGSDNINHPSAAAYARCDIEQGGARLNCDGNGSSGVGTTAVTTNPFQNVAGFAGSGGYYTNPTLPIYTFSRPYQAFTDVSEDHLPQIHSWYNSLQVTAAHNVSKDLSFHLAYTWSKSMSAGNIVDTINRVYGRSIDSKDTPNVVTISSVYYLPFGRGKTFLGHTNRLVDAAVGGWEVSPLYIYTQWYPWSPGSNWEILSPIAIQRRELPVDGTHSYKRLQAVTPCVAYKNTDTGVITDGPSYTENNCTAPALIRTPNGYAVQHNVNYTGVRLPGNHQFDVSLSKRFAWNERANLQLRLDAFNVLNHPNWTYNSSYSNDPTSDNFGTIQKGPSAPNGSAPRDLQISGKITF
jgi:hypothetical protein